ncbi:MAG: hypothetical protein R3A48_05150 [Polyangiales bacterium]
MRLRALLVLSLAWPGVARAQSPIEIVGRSGAVRVPDDAGVEAPSGPSDCAAESWTFEVNLPAATLTAPSIWASAGFSCSLGERAQPNATCFELCGFSQNVCTGGLAAGSSRYRFTIPTRWLVDPSSGQCPAASGRRAVFMVVDGEVVALSPRRVRYDLLPPAPPRDPDLTNFEDRVEVRWSYGGSGTGAVDAGAVTDSGVADDAGDAGAADDAGAASDAGGASSANGGEESVARFYVLCDPPPGAEVAGSDAGASCGTNALSGLDLSRDENLARYQCAPPTLATARTATLTGVRVGGRYSVAVVAEDLVGNRSQVAYAARCAALNPVSDFWEAYRAQGGRASVGVCAVRPGRARPSALALLIALAGAARALRRRR